MATIKINPGSVSKENVRELLSGSCPDLEVKPFGVHSAVAETPWVGTLVMVSKGAVRTAPSIPTMKYLLLAIVLLLVLGGAIPAIIYAVKVLPRQKALEQRVAEVLRRELTAEPARVPA